jgi:hypothetical protein
MKIALNHSPVVVSSAEARPLPTVFHQAYTISLISRNRLGNSASGFLRWPRLFEQKIRVAKWIVGRG